VLPLPVEIPSLRIAINKELSADERAQLRLEELDALDEVRLNAQQNLELYSYRAQMTRAYDKLARVRTFHEGELVLVLRRPILGRHVGPILASGPYVVETFYEGGAYQLIDKNGERPMPPINGRYQNKYYA
jgi:hypothetical protein